MTMVDLCVYSFLLGTMVLLREERGISAYGEWQLPIYSIYFYNNKFIHIIMARTNILVITTLLS